MIFKIIGDTYKVRGTITALSADNLSAQLIGVKVIAGKYI